MKRLPLHHIRSFSGTATSKQQSEEQTWAACFCKQSLIGTHSHLFTSVHTCSLLDAFSNGAVECLPQGRVGLPVTNHHDLIFTAEVCQLLIQIIACQGLTKSPFHLNSVCVYTFVGAGTHACMYVRHAPEVSLGCHFSETIHPHKLTFGNVIYKHCVYVISAPPSSPRPPPMHSFSKA